jgi:hypothetical protein
MVFYISWILQVSMILFTSRKTFNSNFSFFFVWLIGIAFLGIIFMHWKMRDDEEQHFAVQRLR